MTFVFLFTRSIILTNKFKRIKLSIKIEPSHLRNRKLLLFIAIRVLPYQSVADKLAAAFTIIALWLFGVGWLSSERRFVEHFNAWAVAVKGASNNNSGGQRPSGSSFGSEQHDANTPPARIDEQHAVACSAACDCWLRD